MERNESEKIEWVHCNQCLRATRHDVIAVRELHETEGLEQNDFINWTTTNSMLECRGCGNVTLRARVISEAIGWDDTYYYPPRISRKNPRWQYKLPDAMSDLLRESYVALQSGSRRLAIMGARSLVDLFMNLTIGDVGGFEQKLDRLVKAGYLSMQNRDILEAALEAGHAVVHRGHKPRTEDVNLVFDIVENMLQMLVLQKESEGLKKRTPKRAQKQGEAADNDKTRK